MAAMLVAFAAPAMADDNDDWNWNDDRHDNDSWWNWNDDHNDNDSWWNDRFDRFDRDDFCDVFDCRDNNNNNNNDFFVPAVDQDFDQESESGDVDQSFDVSSTGDNSNQTVGTQGVANTGNAQNQIGVIDAGGFGDFDNNNDWWNHNNNDNWWNHNNNDGGDFEFDDVVSTIELSPTNTTSSDQAVDQAATASD